jgi:predicted SAM-dependent methyltransferase
MTLALHIGCGDIHKRGYVNIDHRETGATDMIMNCIYLQDFEDEAADVIESYHLIEHLPRPHSHKDNVNTALRYWFRVLKPGGQLVIECPDFHETVKQYVDGNTARKDNIFGLDRFEGDTHRWGYDFNELKSMLTAAGFTDIKRKPPQDYHKELEPCMRIECSKP